ncbi:hypothetical protein BDR26DRAFT_872630 [Obelidium mucronatum]|nr:hypothetical protein BDR26DRAFT_872630 [Obelidium mucronatum]
MAAASTDFASLTSATAMSTAAKEGPTLILQPIVQQTIVQQVMPTTSPNSGSSNANTSSNDTTTSSGSNSNTIAIILGVCGGIIVLLALAVAVLLVRRRRQRGGSAKAEDGGGGGALVHAGPGLGGLGGLGSGAATVRVRALGWEDAGASHTLPTPEFLVAQSLPSVVQSSEAAQPNQAHQVLEAPPPRTQPLPALEN